MEIALAGNPNVGKSMVFSRLTGVGAITSNYPGTTVEFSEAKAKFMGLMLTVIDLPGTYSLAGSADDERVATKLLSDRRPDTVVAVLDATRLERNLVFLFELIEGGYNVVAALNMYDALRKSKLKIDIARLERILMIPVIPTVATKGEGIDSLLYTAIQMRHRSKFEVKYDSHIEGMIKELQEVIKPEPGGLPVRSAAIRLLMGERAVVDRASDEAKLMSEKMREEFRKIHDEDIVVHIQRDRFGEAGRIAEEVIGRADADRSRKSIAKDITLRPSTGIPILLGVLALMFVTLVFAGGAIETLLVNAWTQTGASFIDNLGASSGSHLVYGILEGISLGVEAILAIVVPYIMVFYFMLAILEDTGYLVRIVSLLDGVMHRLGLHGRAVIPMVVGFGCNVPAILATRAMGSRRERLILATLITITVPCSAQTAIIIGAVGKYAGAWWALLIYLILMGMLVVIGLLLHKAIKFEPTGLCIEIPDMRMPTARQTVIKTYIRIKEFLTIAFPLLLVGSIVIETLLAYNILQTLLSPTGPFMASVFGLPAITAVALVFGILRKEMALQMLMVLGGSVDLSVFMTNHQMFVFALIMAIFMPCLAAFAVMLREFGIKSTLGVTAASVGIALTMGAVANMLLNVL